MKSSPIRLIVCGTDTDVGKTIVSALLVQGLRASYWKPVQSGLEEGGDRNTISKIINLPYERWEPEAYSFQHAVSPHLAAEKENRLIEPKQLLIPNVQGPLVIETAGGLMVPLNRKCLQIDQLIHWKLPVVLVARSGLGTLNHTLLSLEALRQRKICILGLVLNGPIHSDNPKTLEQFGEVPIIAEIPYLKNLTANALADEWEKQQIGTTLEKLMKANFDN